MAQGRMFVIIVKADNMQICAHTSSLRGEKLNNNKYSIALVGLMQTI